MQLAVPEFVGGCPELSLGVAGHVMRRGALRTGINENPSLWLKGVATLADETSGACPLARVLLLTISEGRGGRVRGDAIGPTGRM
jgi:hypothetical protein